VNLEELGIPTGRGGRRALRAEDRRTDLGNVDWLFSYNCSGWRRSARESSGACGTERPTTRAPSAMEERVPILVGWSHEFAEKAGL
jgi:hypothetical protein